MSCPFDEVEAPDPVYRLARGPAAWAWPDWASADDDRTFGNRWDDPQGVYRVVYASTERLATFMETLAPFRPDPQVLDGLNAIVGDDDDELSPSGHLPRSWRKGRVVSQALAKGKFAAVGRVRSLTHLREAFGARLVHYGLSDLDGAAIRIAAPRSLTQEISRYVFDCTEDEARQFAGISYLSKLGDDLTNWAIFEKADITERDSKSIAADDPDLLEAVRLFGITLDDD